MNMAIWALYKLPLKELSSPNLTPSQLVTSTSSTEDENMLVDLQ